MSYTFIIWLLYYVKFQSKFLAWHQHWRHRLSGYWCSHRCWAAILSAALLLIKSDSVWRSMSQNRVIYMFPFSYISHSPSNYMVISSDRSVNFMYCTYRLLLRCVSFIVRLDDEMERKKDGERERESQPITQKCKVNSINMKIVWNQFIMCTVKWRLNTLAVSWVYFGVLGAVFVCNPFIIYLNMYITFFLALVCLSMVQHRPQNW